MIFSREKKVDDTINIGQRCGLGLISLYAEGIKKEGR